MGPAGVWDDPLVPRIRRFVRKRPGSPQLLDVRRWEMTDAEIFGGIDGTVTDSIPQADTIQGYFACE